MAHRYLLQRFNFGLAEPYDTLKVPCAADPHSDDWRSHRPITRLPSTCVTNFDESIVDWCEQDCVVQPGATDPSLFRCLGHDPSAVGVNMANYMGGRWHEAWRGVGMG